MTLAQKAPQGDNEEDQEPQDGGPPTENGTMKQMAMQELEDHNGTMKDHN